MKKLTLLLALPLICILSSCNKETHARIKYEVRTSSNTVISYTVNDRDFEITEGSGSWSNSYRVRRGTTYFLSAYQTAPLYNMEIIVTVDGVVIESQNTRNPEVLTVTGLVPPL
ncbi:MAG: hypothetical protein ABF238_01585 [Flavobacteriales bacterium]